VSECVSVCVCERERERTWAALNKTKGLTTDGPLITNPEFYLDHQTFCG